MKPGFGSARILAAAIHTPSLPRRNGNIRSMLPTWPGRRRIVMKPGSINTEHVHRIISAIEPNRKRFFKGGASPERVADGDGRRAPPMDGERYFPSLRLRSKLTGFEAY